MNIVLIQEQLAHIELTLETEDEFEVYGGTTRAPFEFQPTGVASWRVVVRESEVAGAAIRPFDIYARQRSTGREWVVLSGRIMVKPRTADIEGDKLSPVEYHVTVPVVDSVVETQGMAIVTGIPGPQGPKGEKGDPGEGGMTEAERALLNGAAQRGGDNTFTAANTFTGSLDMSGASVTLPEGWNVDGVTAEAIQSVAPIAWVENTETPLKTSGSIAFGSGAKTVRNNVAIGVDAEARDLANSIGYGSFASAAGQSFGNGTNTGDRGVAVGHYAKSGGGSISIGAQAESDTCSVALGDCAKSRKNTSITIGSQYEEKLADGSTAKHECTTQGTGSITIGAGANTLNNGDTESSNSVTIGCKASNSGADSVVIGAQASGTAAGNVIIGAGAAPANETIGSVLVGRYTNVPARASGAVAIGDRARANYLGVSIGEQTDGNFFSVTVGCQSHASQSYSTALGFKAYSEKGYATAIGAWAKAADYGATVIRSTASDGTYTQLYFSGANTPLANTYHSGAPMLGYVTKDSAGNIVAAGTRSLIDLLTDNSTFQPASLDENGEWVMPKVFHPRDLDMPTEEPSESDEYQPLPVYPIVEPDEDELRTPTGEN